MELTKEKFEEVASGTAATRPPSLIVYRIKAEETREKYTRPLSWTLYGVMEEVPEGETLEGRAEQPLRRARADHGRRLDLMLVLPKMLREGGHASVPCMKKGARSVRI